MDAGEMMGNFSAPVHVSLMEKNVMFDIGTMTFSIIMMVTVVLMSMIHMTCIIIGVIALLICRQVCKKDKMTLEFMFQNMSIADCYRG